MQNPINVSDVAYDATTWNGNTDASTKNAIRDKIETIGSSGRGRSVQFSFTGALTSNANVLPPCNGTFGQVIGHHVGSTEKIVAVYATIGSTNTFGVDNIPIILYKYTNNAGLAYTYALATSLTTVNVPYISGLYYNVVGSSTGLSITPGANQSIFCNVGTLPATVSVANDIVVTVELE
jgi:hypothetical protein